jgi:peptide/nickel transport system permease protein
MAVDASLAWKPIPLEPYWRMVLRRLLHHPVGLVASVVLLTIIAACFVGPVLIPYESDQVGVAARFAPPSAEHWLGGDEFGRDTLARVLAGGRVSLAVGLSVAVMATLLGTAIGVVSGYVGGWVDDVLMRVLDVLHAVPRIALLLLAAKALGPGFLTVIVILTALSWTGNARLARGIALSLKGMPFIEGSRSLGADPSRLIFRHIVPNAASALIVATTLEAGAAIAAEATLSFLGLGILPPLPSWGNLLSNSQTYFWIAPFQVFYPGVAIFLTLLSFNLVGDALRDALDPRSGSALMTRSHQT